MPDGLASTSPAAVGAQIKVKLRRAGMAQGDLAVSLGVDRSTVARYVAGDLNITTTMLGRIADALGCDARDLLTGNDGNEALP